MPRKKYVKRDPEFPVDETSGEDVAEVPTPIAPPAPNPAVLALQEDVVKLIRERSGLARDAEASAEALFGAQARHQATQNKLQRAEQEIQYLHSQIAQLEGRTAPPSVPFVVPTNSYPSSNLAGISSEPTQLQRFGDDGVRRAHADQLRAAL